MGKKKGKGKTKDTSGVQPQTSQAQTGASTPSTSQQQQGRDQGRSPQQKAQQQEASGPARKQQKEPPGQQQSGPSGIPQQQQQRGPQGLPQHQQQQQRGPPGLPQQQQQRGPQGLPQHQQRGPQGLPQQQQWGPPGLPQQQQWGPPGLPQQQQQKQRKPPQTIFPQQQQYGPPQQQQMGSPGVPPQQWGPPKKQTIQQPLSKLQDPSQSQRPDPSQQQQQRGPPQQQRPGPSQHQQQKGGPQQQRPGPSQHQQQKGGPQQQRPIPYQRQQQKGGPQQQRPSPSQQQQTSKSLSPPSKEVSPPLWEGGDCLSEPRTIIPGTRGRKIKVESNHLALNLGNLKEAYHYDVAITPDTPKSLLRDVMKLFGQKNYPKYHPAFDGRKNLYSPIKLPFGDSDSKSDTIEVQGDNRPREFKVEVKLARTVDLTPLHDTFMTRQSPQDALQCLDIVLRNAPVNTCISAGRCFFTRPKDQIIPLGEGMEMYYGFYQSAIRGWKALLNVDVAHKAFPKCLNLLDLTCELGSDYRNTMTRDQLDRPLHRVVEETLKKFIRQLKVEYEITGKSSTKRIYRVNDLGPPPSQARFTLDNGTVTTVEKYYENEKRYKLRYPHLPTLWVGSRERQSKILLPLEFCMVVAGQVVNRKMTENQTSAMIKKAATSTDVRKDKIMRSLNDTKYNEDACVREFGFSVNNRFEQLDARVLRPPSLLYADNAEIRPTKGVWRADRNRFLVGAPISKWTIACFTRYPNRSMEQLAEMVYKMANTSGMQITARALPPFTHIGGRQSLQDITDYFSKKRDFDLIFVVVPNSGPQYSYVKKAAELNIGCLTQCIKERTIGKLNPQTVGNILLKVNSKLNGMNHSFALPSLPPIMQRPCMIMGADVTHPSPDAKDIPSVAAVTASHDPKAFKYNICWRLQPPKVEIIEDLLNITREQLMFFYKQTGFKPEKIVFFRDGVSEGQFGQVMKAEISAIQKACKALQREDYEPKITFLVVQKRHHTRLFPMDRRDSEDKNYNVPAGTCVDTHITNPTMQDFYLVSHASIQGVAKPTKYCTLWDDNDMSNDDIEELAYHLCHMFTRCNRSVSYPAPTYYAHLAAARAKVYIENDKLNLDHLQRHQQTYQIQESILRGKPMFFV